MKIKNLIVSGDSFSYSGVGGMPPTQSSSGGNSYLYDEKYQTMEPFNWPGFMAKQLSVASLVNTATAAHGNILISYTIFELLKKYNYHPHDTLIIFNLSEPARLDVPCDFHDSNADNFVRWDQNLLSHSYLTMPHQLPISDAIEKYTSESTRFLMEYLKSKKFVFYFLLMNNYLDHEYLGPVINDFNEHLIQLDPGPSMKEFAIATKTTVSNYDQHPNLEGHRMIADAIYKRIINDVA